MGAGYYQSDRDVESGRSKLRTGGEALPQPALGVGAGGWQAGWAQRWPKAYLTTGHVKPVSEPDSKDHTRRHQALAGVGLRVWTLDALQLPQLLDPDLGGNSQAAMPSRSGAPCALCEPRGAMGLPG